LAEYSLLNFPRQEYYAVERNIYYGLRKQGILVNENSKEGQYCLEVWKYEPHVSIRLTTSSPRPLHEIALGYKNV
jgi:hypothetical protein